MSVIVSPSEEREREQVGPVTCPLLVTSSCSGPWGEDAQASGRGGGVIPEARMEVAGAGRADRPSMLTLLSSLWETV